MSFEGYFQCICERGHYWEVDVYSSEDNIYCPHCSGDAVWENMVDTTNGSYEGKKRIDGYVEPKLLSSKICKHCGHVHERIYEIPKKKRSTEHNQRRTV